MLLLLLLFRQLGVRCRGCGQALLRCLSELVGEDEVGEVLLLLWVLVLRSEEGQDACLVGEWHTGKRGIMSSQTMCTLVQRIQEDGSQQTKVWLPRDVSLADMVKVCLQGRAQHTVHA